MIKEHVEQIADGGSAFFERELSLKTLGVDVSQCTSLDDVLREAHLHDWNVRKVPAYAVDEDGMTPIPGKYGIVRDVRDSSGEKIGQRSLGAVGSKYHTKSNESAFAFVDQLVDGNGQKLPVEFAGSMYDGRRVFLGMKLPDQIIVGAGEADDEIDMRLLMTNTHDGTQPFTVALHINRVPCTNAIELTKRHAKAAGQHWTMRHTAQIDDEQKLVLARETLQLTLAAADEFKAQASELYAKRISERQFERLVENVFPIEPLATQRKRDAIAQTRLEVRTIYRDAPTQQKIKGTAWGALNAFVEWADWARDVRPGKTDPRVARALSQLDSHHVERFKSNVMGRVLAMK